MAATALALLLLVGGVAAAEDDPRIEQMQRQIEALQRELDALRSEVNQVKKLPPPPAPAPAADQPRVVTSGNDRIKVEISGQVNRAVNVANDGRSTKAYFVDSDASLPGSAWSAPARSLTT